MKVDLSNIILNIIRIYGPISKLEIASSLDISVTAVTNHVNVLLSSGIIVEEKTDHSSGGRKPIALKINKDYGYIIGIDFGQGTLRLAIGDMNHNIIYKKERPSIDLRDSKIGMKIIIDEIKALIEMQGTAHLIGIGLSISGIINHDLGICHVIPAFNGWHNIPFKSILEETFNVPVYIDDSARCAALAESIQEKGRIKDLIYVSLGIGIGMGIIMDWNLFRGKSGFAGEIGHIIVKEDGLQCGCGNKGCLEQYLSIPSLIQRIISSVNDGVNTLITEYADNDLNSITGEIIGKATKNQDKLAYTIVLEAGYYLGRGLSYVTTLFNPDLIILGGGGIRVSPHILSEAQKTITKHSVNQSAIDVKIVESHDTYNALVGSLIMVGDYFFKLAECKSYPLVSGPLLNTGE
jgi:predicted NBD/HSP70 family sugar kinase